MTIKIRYEDIIKECDSILHDLSLNIDTDTDKLNDMITKYFPDNNDIKFNQDELEEISKKMKQINLLLAKNHDILISKNSYEIEQIKKYKKYMDVIDMVEEK